MAISVRDLDDSKDFRDNLAFSITIIADVIVLFSISIRMYMDMKNMMVASQRIVEYTDLATEDDLVKKGDAQLQKQGWPQKGRVTFEDLSMKYREEMDPSLRNLSADVKAGYKVGIVGRTGAGKSTILQVMFRLTEPCGGRIIIDNVDIQDIGLHLLRKNIAYIPQSPFII